MGRVVQSAPPRLGQAPQRLRQHPADEDRPPRHHGGGLPLIESPKRRGETQEGQDEAPGQAEQEQDATEDGRDPDGKDPDERDAENLAHLTRFVKALVRPARPSPARAEAQPATPPGGREHHLTVRDAG